MKPVVVLAALLVVIGSASGAARSGSRAPSFARATTYPTARSPTSVAIGDLNRDGKQDLAAGIADDDSIPRVSVLLGRGGGRFQAKRDYRTGVGPRSVAIGDLDGDGTPDLATANYDDNSVSVLLNRGNGTFRAKADYAAGPAPLSVAIGDLDGRIRGRVVGQKPKLGVVLPGGSRVDLVVSRGRRPS